MNNEENYNTQPEKKGVWYKLMAWFPLLFLLANQYRMFDNSATPYVVSLALFGGIGWIALGWMRNKVRMNVLLMAFLYLLTGLFNHTVVGNTTLTSLAYDFMVFGLIAIMFHSPYSYLQGIIATALLIFYFVLEFLRGNTAAALLVSSQNYVSVCLVMAMSVYYIGIDNSEKPLRIFDLLPVTLCLLLSVWATGRGGIVSSLFMLVGIAFVYLGRIMKKRGLGLKLLVYAAIALVLVYWVGGALNITDEVMSLGKLGTKGTDMSERMAIWSDYYNTALKSSKNFLFGAPFAETELVSYFEGNTHNSFLYLHATNGLLMFLVFTFMLIRSIIFFIRRKKFVLLVVILTMFLRGFTDKFIFGQYGMPIMMYLVMYPYIYRDDTPKMIRDQLGEAVQTE